MYSLVLLTPSKEGCFWTLLLIPVMALALGRRLLPVNCSFLIASCQAWVLVRRRPGDSCFPPLAGSLTRDYSRLPPIVLVDKCLPTVGRIVLLPTELDLPILWATLLYFLLNISLSCSCISLKDKGWSAPGILEPTCGFRFGVESPILLFGRRDLERDEATLGAILSSTFSN